MSEKDYIIIESYLEGTLAPAAAAAVEDRAASDPLFAQALAARRRLYEHLRAVATEEDFIQQLKPLNATFFQDTTGEGVVKPMRSGRRWWIGLVAAAVLALALLLGGRLFAPTGSVYEQFAQHQPLSLTERGLDNAALAAETAFNAGRYAEAIDRLQGYLEVQEEDQRAQLALGIALLERHRDAEAVAIFTDIAQSKTALAPYGNWYLALAAVKRGDNEEALRLLELIPPEDAYLAARVRKLKATL